MSCGQNVRFYLNYTQCINYIFMDVLRIGIDSSPQPIASEKVQHLYIDVYIYNICIYVYVICPYLKETAVFPLKLTAWRFEKLDIKVSK